VRGLWLVAGVASAIGGGLAGAATPEDAEFFELRVRPVLAEHCFSCHGGKEEVEGELRLTSRTLLLEGGASGPAAVPGDAPASLLVQAVEYRDALQMPPDGKLADADVEALREWVARGLPWPEERAGAAGAGSGHDKSSSGFQISDEARAFWSFQPIARPAPPQVNNEAWPAGAIDQFILARLEQAGLPPAAAADRRTLIRRATYDLTGLPPTPQEVEAFVRDDSPDAFAKVVDRLLASPEYGQRWARHWLDLVRYTDSFDARIADGANVMDCSAAWRYRDWVVDALNSDMPYDEFLTNQIAGDLLPAAGGQERNIPGIVATGVLAIGNWGGGDADKEKLLTDIADDQIDLVGRAMLGLTLACARCHDHKFDPISTADYYALAGIFMSTHILEDPGPKTNGPPMLRVSLETAADVERRGEYDRRLASLRDELAGLRQEQFARLAEKQLEDAGRTLRAAWQYAHWPSTAPRPAIEQFAADQGLPAFALRGWIEAIDSPGGALLASVVENLAGNPGLYAWKGAGDTPSAVANASDAEVGFLTIRMPPRTVAIHPSPAAGVAVEWRATAAGRYRIAGRLRDADPNCGDGVDWSLAVSRGRSQSQLAAGSVDNGGQQNFDDAKNAASLAEVSLAAGESLQLAVLPRGDHSCDTTLVDLEISEAGASRTWNLARDVTANPLEGGVGNPHGDSAGNAGVWRLVDLAGAGAAPPLVSQPLLRAWYEIAAQPADDDASREQASQAADAVQQALDRALQEPSSPDEAAAGLRKFLVSRESPFWGEGRGGEALLPPQTRAELQRLVAELASLSANPPAEPGYAHACLEGGCPKSPQEGLHDVRIHIRGRYDRLGELVPRRFPEILAGADQPPIGPGSGRRQLAQWLVRPDNPLVARVMVNRIWQQHFGQGIVRTPSNFGELGERPTHPELLDWLASEFIARGWSTKAMHRLIMASAAYQQSSQPAAAALEHDPENRLFGRMNRRRVDAEQLRDSLLAASGALDRSLGGPAVRDIQSPRRTLYLMTIRSDRTSFRDLFDAADATAIVDQRNVSIVAPQALFLLNHPLVQAQASRLAERARAARPQDADRIDRLYRWLFGRGASPDEQQLALALLEKWRGAGKGRAADEVEARAWIQYCQVLICSNEFAFID
jgi:hypothetical protein